MKTIKEVIEITGLTRKALRWYDQKGLVHPTVKEAGANGMWLYDDSAILNLMGIIAFSEAEYTLDEIKILMSKPNYEMDEIYSEMIRRLEEKRKRIDGLIGFAQGSQLALKLPEVAAGRVYETMIKNINENCMDSSFKDTFSELVDDFSEGQLDSAEIEMGGAIFTHIIALGNMASCDPAEKDVQDYLQYLFETLLAYGKEIDAKEGADVSEEENLIYAQETMRRLVETPESLELMNQYCSPEGVEFILKAVDLFLRNKQKHLN